MTIKKREVIYDVTVLKPYLKLPVHIRNDFPLKTLLPRLLRYYFEFRVENPGKSISNAKCAAGLAYTSAMRLLSRTVLKYDHTYQATLTSLVTIFQEIDRYTTMPGAELPNELMYNEKQHLDEGIPRDMFRHYTGKLTTLNILGVERWFIHFDLEMVTI